MKSLLSFVSLAAVIAASAAYADSETLYVEQLGTGQNAQFTQSGGLYNNGYILQNGNGEQAIILQSGQNNFLNARQGMVNAAGDNSAPHAYEGSSGSEYLASTQVGDSNQAVLASVGVSNQLIINQQGNSNSINSYINENLSFTQVTQNGYLNTAVTHQGR